MVQYKASGSFSRISEGYHNFDVDASGIVVGLEEYPDVAKVLVARGLVLEVESEEADRVGSVNEVDAEHLQPIYGDTVQAVQQHRQDAEVNECLSQP